MIWFTQARAQFGRWCIDNKMYYTLCLAGASEISLDDTLGFLAGMSNTGDKIKLIFHPKIEPLVKTCPRAFYFLMFHEIRHIIQAATTISAFGLPDLSPLVLRGQKMLAAVEDEEKKKDWCRWLGQLSDRSNPVTQGILKQACNIGMDVAVNQDCVELFGLATKETIEDFLNEDNENKENQKKLVTIERLSERCGYEIAKGMEWVYYANEYIKAISNDIDDPDDSPKEVFIQLGDHSGHGSLSSDEETQSVAQRTSDMTVARSKREAKLNAEKAGTELGSDMLTTASVQIDKRMKTLLDGLKFRLKKILYPSPEEQYTFAKNNRMWPQYNLPGTESVMKAKPSVVVVIDTSGSCWTADMLNQMMAAAKHFHKKGLLASVWGFDMTIVEIPFSGSRPVTVSGGGGTMWGVTFVDDILTKLKRKKIDLVLLSDMEIFGLIGLEQDKRVNLHKVDIRGFLK